MTKYIELRKIMDWKTEFEQMKEKIERLGCTCMEYEEVLEIKEALIVEGE